ncbi:fasciclin-like arabinogalactan protein 19 [Arachis stenosperma]|uniref:fasciclin-like arabinogalactan protein 19 n=1 Tax=Arachis stenosperma TaxID=217475 RepID=UPI0025AC7D81|nr:fasciclin-like arabinogalactan protein 19 [Arachis stenosperma]
MAIWLVVFITLFAVGESQPTPPFNQTDLQEAMADMRSKSYYGFVILLKILNSQPNSLQTNDLTFLMPSDEELSQYTITPDQLHDFIFSHSIPTSLVLNHLLHFPNGSVVPSSLPSRVISITNSGRAGLFVNNAKVVTPNVCQTSFIRCHGISAALTFENDAPFRRVQDPKNPPKGSDVPVPNHSVKKMSIPPLY